MRKTRIIIMTASILFSANRLNAQSYTTANAHSHNDYEQRVPFYAAWKAGFGSIEADIFLEKGKLIVAHDTVELRKGHTLDSLYLQPLVNCINTCKGNVYPDASRELVLLVDVKTEAVSTLRALVQKLNTYPALLNTASLKIVISGNRPLPADFSAWPGWMLFDGNPRATYTKEQLSRVGMFSDNFINYSRWRGQNELTLEDKKTLEDVITKVHQLNKKIRLWNAPDTENSWLTFMNLRIDYINTDHIESLSQFFHQPAMN